MEVITKLYLCGFTRWSYLQHNPSFQICGGLFVFVRLLQVRYVKVSAELELFVTLSTPHDAEVIKPTHNDSTLTQDAATPHKNKAEIYQQKEKSYTHLTAVMGREIRDRLCWRHKVDRLTNIDYRRRITSCDLTTEPFQTISERTERSWLHTESQISGWKGPLHAFDWEPLHLCVFGGLFSLFLGGGGGRGCDPHVTTPLQIHTTAAAGFKY